MKRSRAMLPRSNGVPLTELVQAVSPEPLRLVRAGRADARVTTVEIADATGPAPSASAVVLLADPQALQPTAAGPAAVVVREPVGALPETGTAVLAIGPSTPWDHVYDLLASVLARRGATAAGELADTGDLGAFADAVAALVGGAVTIEDHQARVLAYSGLADQVIDADRRESILAREAPRTPRNRGEYLDAVRSPTALRFAPPDGSDYGRLAVAVRAGARVLGFIWVVDDSASVAPDALTRLDEAAGAAAARLLAIGARGRATSERDAAAHRLLDGHADSAAIARLGLRSDTPVHVIAFLGEDGDAHWIEGLASLIARARHPHAVCISAGREILALLPGTLDSARDVAAELVDRVPATWAGIGPGAPLAAAASSRAEAVEVAAALVHERSSTRVATRSEVYAPVTLHALRVLAHAHPELLRGPAGALGRGASPLPDAVAETVRMWLACSGETSRVAALLHVHPNTVRHRLKRAETLLGIDLADLDQRLVLALQLRLMD